MLLWLAFLILFNIVRLSASYVGIDILVLGGVANVINFVFFVGCSIFVIILWSQRARVSVHSIFFILALFYGWVFWGVNEGSSVAAVKHVYLIVFAFVSFEFGRLFLFALDFNRLKGVFFLSFFLNLIAVPAFIVISSLYKVYPGYGVQSIAYVCFYFLVAGNKYLFIIASLILVAQGKRSIFLSYLFCLVVYFTLVVLRSRFLLFIGCLLFPVILLSLLFLIDFFSLYSMPGLSRLKYISPFSGDFDLFIGSSGRADEFLSVIRGLDGAYLPYLFGAGFGFTYEWTLSYLSDFSEVKSYLHNSPLMIYILLGPFFVLLFYVYFLGKSLSVMRSRGWDQSSERVLRFSSLSAVFFLVSGGFSLNILSDPVGWVLLGVVCAYAKNTMRVPRYLYA